jgi:hypothetical protein
MEISARMSKPTLSIAAQARSSPREVPALGLVSSTARHGTPLSPDGASPRRGPSGANTHRAAAPAAIPSPATTATPAMVRTLGWTAMGSAKTQ